MMWELKRLRKLRVVAGTLALVLGVLASDALAENDHNDFGVRVERLLNAQSEKLFGIEQPLNQSALGPFNGPNAEVLVVAKGLEVSVVSNATHPQADMIALWPDDLHPTHLFVCVENFFSGNNPSVVSVQRVSLAGHPNSNVETIVKGISSCDPIRRTPWGTLVVGEESGADGGLYEILDPLGISAATPVIITDRAAGTASDPARIAKRKAVGSLSFEGQAILPDGTMYFGDENRPLNGRAGGGIFKFVPSAPHNPADGPIADLAQSPLASGTVYGLRLGTLTSGGNRNADFGQGSEIGRGVWLRIFPGPLDGNGNPVVLPSLMDANGNIILRNAHSALGLTGYYRPEDMDRDPIAAAGGVTRVCWTNTGRMTNGAASAIEGAANYGEVLCLRDDPIASAPSGAVPLVERFINGDPDASHFDNVAFQPHTGSLVVLEDGEVEVRNPDGTLKELRGNDLWICLPDGADRDVLTDGCTRFASVRDTDAEPTGLIFDASGGNAYVNIQHRSTGQGALLMISGFKVK